MWDARRYNLLLTFAFTSAFLQIRVSTASKWPRSTAQCKGVLPSLSKKCQQIHEDIVVISICFKKWLIIANFKRALFPLSPSKLSMPIHFSQTGDGTATKGTGMHGIIQEIL